MNRILLLASLALLYLAGCHSGGGDDHSVEQTGLSPTLERIIIAPDPVFLAPSQGHQLTATGILSDGTMRDVTREALWESSSQQVATVGNGDGCGLVRALSAGQTVITAAVGDLQAHSQVVVSASTGGVSPPPVPGSGDEDPNTQDPGQEGPVLQMVSIAPQEVVLYPLKTRQFRALGTYSDGRVVDLTQANDTTWSTSDRDVVALTGKGEVRAYDEGTAMITAVFGEFTASAKVTVTFDQPLALLLVSPAKFFRPAAEYPFTAIVHYGNGRISDVTDLALWSSGNPSVAKVSNDPGKWGRVTTFLSGRADILARWEDLAQSVEVQVE